jgi:hypothetical protein
VKSRREKQRKEEGKEGRAPRGHKLIFFLGGMIFGNKRKQGK